MTSTPSQRPSLVVAQPLRSCAYAIPTRAGATSQLFIATKSLAVGVAEVREVAREQAAVGVEQVAHVVARHLQQHLVVAARDLLHEVEPVLRFRHRRAALATARREIVEREALREEVLVARSAAIGGGSKMAQISARASRQGWCVEGGGGLGERDGSAREGGSTEPRRALRSSASSSEKKRRRARVTGR